ncbi:MAG: ExbD/TolR family protein [Deltaproteobacteria bacterium]|nr:MAG: ExbD/TolR family protein [Deltaproteobacteria bacterium]
MGMSTGSDPGGMMSEINVTPFVDVMLVLLIIFMVTAPMMTTGMQVELPRADAPALPTDPDDQMILSVTADGRYFIGEHEFTFEELGPKLEAIARNNPDQDVFLKADGQVPYETVARLLALCTNAGIARMGMVTQPGVGDD